MNTFPRPTPNTLPAIQDVLYWVCEREQIRIRKIAGLPPYTQDPILARYKFCNVRRRDDRVSQWIYKHMIKPNETKKDLWFDMLLARLVNWPPSLYDIIRRGVIPEKAELFNECRFTMVLEDRKECNLKLYTGAYMVYPTKKDIGGNKSTALARHIIGPIARDAEYIRSTLAGNSVRRFVDVLSHYDGISTFIAGQVAADLTYSEHQLGNADDLLTYAPIGPGSSRGLNRLYGKPLSRNYTQEEFDHLLIAIMHLITDEAGVEVHSLHDVQNVMCEMDKYWRTLYNEGRPRSLYKPEEAF